MKLYVGLALFLVVAGAALAQCPVSLTDASICPDRNSNFLEFTLCSFRCQSLLAKCQIDCEGQPTATACVVLLRFINQNCVVIPTPSISPSPTPTPSLTPSQSPSSLPTSSTTPSPSTSHTPSISTCPSPSPSRSRPPPSNTAPAPSPALVPAPAPSLAPTPSPSSTPSTTPTTSPSPSESVSCQVSTAANPKGFITACSQECPSVVASKSLLDIVVGFGISNTCVQNCVNSSATLDSECTSGSVSSAESVFRGCCGVCGAFVSTTGSPIIFQCRQALEGVAAPPAEANTCKVAPPFLTGGSISVSCICHEDDLDRIFTENDASMRVAYSVPSLDCLSTCLLNAVEERCVDAFDVPFFDYNIQAIACCSKCLHVYDSTLLSACVGS